MRPAQVGVELSLVLANDDDEHVVSSHRRVNESSVIEVDFDGVAERLVVVGEVYGVGQVRDFDGGKVHRFAFALAGVVCFDVVTIDYSPPNYKRNRGLIPKINKIIAETRKRRAKR